MGTQRTTKSRLSVDACLRRAMIAATEERNQLIREGRDLDRRLAAIASRIRVLDRLIEGWKRHSRWYKNGTTRVGVRKNHELSPADKLAIRRAYTRSSRRTWSSVKKRLAKRRDLTQKQITNHVRYLKSRGVRHKA